MKRLLILLTFGAMISVSFSPATSICSNEVDAFDDGEFMKYKVFFNWKSVWLRAGTAEFNVTDERLEGNEVMHLKAVGTTYKTYNWFYKVHDVYESYIHSDSKMPYRFIRNVNEGGYTIFEDYTFDWSDNSVFTRHENFKTPMKEGSYDITGCTQDIVSAIYNIRCVDYSGMKVGDKVPIDIFLDNQTYSLYVEYLGKEIVKTDAGTFRCVKARPLLIKGRIFDEVDGMAIYVTDDENRMPVLIETPISVGSVKAVLVDYSGLQGDVSAKLN